MTDNELRKQLWLALGVEMGSDEVLVSRVKEARSFIESFWLMKDQFALARERLAAIAKIARPD